VILLDTHIWIWWVHDSPQLTARQRILILNNEERGLAVSVISCWEIAKLVEYNRLSLPCSVDDWFSQALAYPGIQLVGLTPQIALESTRLPGNFHRDPADQIIVATARINQTPLLTADSRITNYQHVTLAT
jgi:PIN domain nuclease of toxin-antitoxin system